MISRLKRDIQGSIATLSYAAQKWTSSYFGFANKCTALCFSQAIVSAAPIAEIIDLNCFYMGLKSDNMAGVSTSLKCVITLAVVFGILYVLISPLPEMDAAFSGKSALSYFVLITQAILGLYFLVLLMRFRPIDWNETAHGDVLELICVRLC